MGAVALNDEQQSQEESFSIRSIYTNQIDMEHTHRCLFAEEKNLKSSCATWKQHDVFVRIRVDVESYFNGLNTIPGIKSIWCSNFCYWGNLKSELDRGNYGWEFSTVSNS